MAVKIQFDPLSPRRYGMGVNRNANLLLSKALLCGAAAGF